MILINDLNRNSNRFKSVDLNHLQPVKNKFIIEHLKLLKSKPDRNKTMLKR